MGRPQGEGPQPEEIPLDNTYQPEPSYPLPENDSTMQPPPAPQPAQYPPQNPQYQPAQYQPQPQPATYPSQKPTYPPAQPASYPPQNPTYQPQPQTATYPPQNPAYPPAQPASYPPQNPTYPPQASPANYVPQASPQQFPPQPQTVQFPPPIPQPQYPPQPQSPYKTPPGPPQPGIPVVQYPMVPTEGWKTGLFDCMDDPTNTLITFFFPCLTFGQVAEIVDNGQTSCGTSGLLYGLVLGFIGLPCIYSCTYRTKLRSKFGLVESPAPDWVTHFLCEYCALCQEYRELQLRGLDPSIGWLANVARQQQQAQVQMVPPPTQTMMG
ncbi:PREDICTED: protein PLANT CADMIUM RESISTANCE 6-like [Nelumbo nucifera]|uniref:Protein PLANT CADMIUM RESISTANCE 6-like n=2 Tax=Nelumbo nucifera TaxID=4432 RepID=A0A1U8AQH6_NELNU|nr:PREDICTED: protein PLANT CADMIUM RESISTANCE 6-like [Nelumbo nucifera]DAD31735.1 TPA_asm: hypothetical protein HUJ06_010586 [Nelumbo nucifera]